MKNLNVGIVIFILLMPLKVLAESDYKCHVSLSSAEPILINRFANSAEAAKKALKDIIITHNKRRLRINHVFECVLMQQSFKSEEARLLQKSTRF